MIKDFIDEKTAGEYGFTVDEIDRLSVISSKFGRAWVMGAMTKIQILDEIEKEAHGSVRYAALIGMVTGSLMEFSEISIEDMIRRLQRMMKQVEDQEKKK